MLSRGLIASGKQRHPMAHLWVAEAALFGTIALGTLTGGANIANAQQARPAKGGESQNGAITTNQGLDVDPNLPGVRNPSSNVLPIVWDNSSGTTHEVAIRQPMSSGSAHYLGHNDEGSWLQHPDNKHIYVWKYEGGDNGALTERYKGILDIPDGTVASLKGGKIQFYLAPYKKSAPAGGAAVQPKPANAEPQIVGGNSPQGAFFNDPNAVRGALAGFQKPAGAQSAGSAVVSSGTDARIAGGVLTFTLANGSKATYKVLRPAFMANNPQATAGIAGVWVAMEDGGKGMMFTVQPDHTVSGKEMPAAMIQMLMQPAGQH